MRHFSIIAVLLAICLKVFGQAGHYFPSERFSSGLINDICQDKYGYIWVATDYGLNKFDGYRFTQYLHNPQDTTSISSNTTGCLFCDKDGQLWVGTTKGFDRYDYATNQFVHQEFEYNVHPRVTKIIQLKKDGKLLVCTSGFGGIYVVNNGLAVKNQTGNTEMAFVNSAMEDNQGRYWQCGYGNEFFMRDDMGVHDYTSTQGFVVDFAERGDEVLIFGLHGIHSFRHNQLTVADIDMTVMNKGNSIIRRVFKARNGNIYIGTRGDGLFVLPKNSRRLERVACVAKNIDLTTSKIWAITEDRHGNLWLGCQSKGLLMIQPTPPQFQSWAFQPQGINLGSTVSSVCNGDDGVVWCTVPGNGIYGFNVNGRVVAHPTGHKTAELIYRDHSSRYWVGTDEGLYAYNPLTGQSTLHVSFNCDKFNDMVDDGKGNLYVSTFSRGFCQYNPTTHYLRNFNTKLKDPQKGWLCNNWVMDIMADHLGRIWLATSSGVSCYDPKSDSFKSLGWHQLLGGTMCYSLGETKKGQILIGTDHGIYIYEKGQQEARLFGLESKIVSYIVEAKNGDLWCATSTGIWQYDQKNGIFISHINDNGLSGKEYINCVGLHTADDRVYFANNEGLVTFKPAQVKNCQENLPAVNLTGFMIAGHPIASTMFSDYYSVSYLDNALTLEFSLLDYANADNIVFEYRIGGSEWIQNSEGQNSIQLNHLQPGVYKIEVRAILAGVTSETKIITVEVTPPWYQSTWAYIIYFFAGLALVIAVGLSLRRRAHQHLDEEKMKFLINTTHDIRSPLTLIMGPLAKLKKIVTTGEAQSYIDTIDRNAQRLMLLVNQILDENRIDKNQMQLHCRETNLVEFISGICKLYQYNANQRNITFLFEHDKKHVIAWVDRINFDKVISNLLANAFKYTFDGGEVKVVLRETEKDIEIQIVDSGVGIKEDEAEKLFNRFYQGHHTNALGMQGTGIGLNLSRSITHMHGGQIKAGNRKDGVRGACFTVTLPKGNAHLKPEQILSDAPALEVLSESADKKNQYRQFGILVVDDDPEIADYIIGELGRYYRFDQAPNGKEALKCLLTRQYDLVISDVMMPEMDGLTLLKRIKDNSQISQIPVILLTSKAEVENKLEGLKSGADAYIAKPFSMEELRIQIDNLIDNVRRLRGKFSGAVQQEERVENIQVKGNDDALMERVMRSINANMSDPEYNIDTLAGDVGLSRSQLHRKMKEITGISSGKFLRNLRMEQAARLLREGKVNVSQVADKVGYYDQAHFSTAFKTHFGMSPSEYVETHKDN